MSETPQEEDVVNDSECAMETKEPIPTSQQALTRSNLYRAMKERCTAQRAAHNPTIAFILRRKMRRPKADGR